MKQMDVFEMPKGMKIKLSVHNCWCGNISAYTAGIFPGINAVCVWLAVSQM